MLFHKIYFVFACLLLIVIQAGCNKSTAVEVLQLRFDAMKAATKQFHEELMLVTDIPSAEKYLDDLKATHRTLAEAVVELDEAMETSSRATRSLKRQVVDYKVEQKAKLRVEFDRFKKDEKLREFLEPFLRKINAL